MRAVARLFVLAVCSIVGVGAAVTPAVAAGGGPTGLTTAGQDCVTEVPGPYLSPVLLNDADAVVLKGTYAGAKEGQLADFQVWDVGKPEAPQQWRDGVDYRNGGVYVQLEDPSRQLDGVTYGWKVRVLDGEVATPWSDTCYFTVDRTGGQAPSISSAEYPAGGWDFAHGAIGVAGSFTFTSVSADTVRYLYRFTSSEAGGDDDYSAVDATRLGGPASVSWTPPAAGSSGVTVYAVDRAGNSSSLAYHEFYVRETRPSVFSAAYQNHGYPNLDYNVGVPGEFQFTASLPDTASFAWRIDDDGPSGAVTAVGQRATLLIAPVRSGRQTLYVRSVAADGLTHAERAYPFFVDNGPRVSGNGSYAVIIGSSLTIPLTPRAPKVVEYAWWPRTYDGDREDLKVTGPAGPDGAKTITWTAINATRDTVGLYVQTRSSDGTVSTPRYLTIGVDQAVPTVTRSGGDGLGTRATFTARSSMTGVVEYDVYLGYGQPVKRTLRASADGSVTFGFTSPTRGYTVVSVVARNRSGVVSGSGGTYWTVSDSPVVTSADFLGSVPSGIKPGTFTFTARQPGAVAFEYSVNGTWITAAAVNGTASVRWTPPATGYFSLYTRSVTANGTRSMETATTFFVGRSG